MAEAQKKPDIILAGGGQVGLLALSKLKERIAVVIDPYPGEELGEYGALVLEGRAEQLVGRFLYSGEYKWLIPASPGHLLADWLVAENPQRVALKEYPPAQLPQTPFLQSAGKGRFYLSLADFICPPDCPEPADHCTHTGKPRGRAMFERLADTAAVAPWQSAVVRSRQLAPGLGGMLISEMLAAKEKILNRPGLWLVSAACRCHGAAQGLQVEAGV